MSGYKLAEYPDYPEGSMSDDDKTYGFDAHITVMAKGQTKEEAADAILENCMDGGIAMFLAEEGSLNKSKCNCVATVIHEKTCAVRQL